MILRLLSAALVTVVTGCATHEWQVNDRARPRPPKVEPMYEAELAVSSKPPPGAIVLFDGKDLSAWQPSKWKVGDGYVEIVKKAGDLVSRESFGSCRLHVEWRTPLPAKGKDQSKGNSGVFLMGKYEVQVLDNTDNPTYADGMAGAIYGENPPLVDASRPSGEWNFYDITFRRPTFGLGGAVVRPATVTVYLNGIKVQDNFRLTGPTNHKIALAYAPHPDKLPLVLQNHGQVVRYRNIWIVPID
jgi:hypothetical protein